VDFSAPEAWIAMAVAATAGGVRGITGFGGAMVMAPPFALLLGPRLAVPVVMLLEGIAALPMVWQTRAQIHWPTIGPILAAACVTIPLGGYLLVNADPVVLRRATAATVIVFALLMLRGWRYRGRRRMTTALGLGGLSGAMTGATSVGAPPVILYLLAGPDPIAITRASLSFYLAGISLAAVIMLWSRDLLDQQSAWIALLLSPVYFVGLVAGVRLFSRFNDARFRQFTLLLLIAVSTGILLA
jgi:uncharacterized membrane protein YfcA